MLYVHIPYNWPSRGTEEEVHGSHLAWSPRHRRTHQTGTGLEPTHAGAASVAPVRITRAGSLIGHDDDHRPGASMAPGPMQYSYMGNGRPPASQRQAQRRIGRYPHRRRTGGRQVSKQPIPNPGAHRSSLSNIRPSRRRAACVRCAVPVLYIHRPCCISRLISLPSFGPGDWADVRPFDRVSWILPCRVGLCGLDWTRLRKG